MSEDLPYTQTVSRLTEIWAKRYVPDPAAFPKDQDSPMYEALVKAASPEGRALTAEKLCDRLVEAQYQFASMRAQAFYEYIPNVLDLGDARRLTSAASELYLKLLELYQQPKSEPSPQQTAAYQEQTFHHSQQPVLHQFQVPLKSTNPLVELELSSESLKVRIWTMANTPTDKADGSAGSSADSLTTAKLPPNPTATSNWNKLDVRTCYKALAPVFEGYKRQFALSKNWRSPGFLTTQLNFSNEILLQKLTLAEQVLVRPYFKFLEEIACIPWQRVCAAATQHEHNSNVFQLVEQMVAVAPEIAQAAYTKMTREVPDHHSRRGKLTDPGVTHSCLRDLEMFQAYLWLAVLEQNFAPIENELLNVCIMVMEVVNVKWDLISRWNQILTIEILQRLNSDQRSLFQPYATILQESFYRRRSQLGEVRQTRAM